MSTLNYVAKNEVTGQITDEVWETKFTPAQRSGRQTGVWKVGVETVLQGE